MSNDHEHLHTQTAQCHADVLLVAKLTKVPHDFFGFRNTFGAKACVFQGALEVGRVVAAVVPHQATSTDTALVVEETKQSASGAETPVAHMVPAKRPIPLPARKQVWSQQITKRTYEYHVTP